MARVSKKLLSIIEQTKLVLSILEKEIENGDSIWDKLLLKEYVYPEIKELQVHFLKGEKFFKYGEHSRLLFSAYKIIKSKDNLSETELGKAILELQKTYDKL